MVHICGNLSTGGGGIMMKTQLELLASQLNESRKFSQEKKKMISFHLL